MLASLPGTLTPGRFLLSSPHTGRLFYAKKPGVYMQRAKKILPRRAVPGERREGSIYMERSARRYGVLNQIRFDGLNNFRAADTV